MNFSPLQKRKLKLLKFLKNDKIAIADEFCGIEEKIEKIEEKIDEVSVKTQESISTISEELKKKLESELVLEIDREELKGDKGDDGHSITEEEVLALIRPIFNDLVSDEKLLGLIKPLIPEIKNGETPSDEKLISLIKTLIPESKKELIITDEHIDKITDKVSKKIQPKESKVKIEDLVSEILKLPPEKGLSSKHISGLDQTISALQEQFRRGYLHGGGDTVKAGTNITITKDANGAKIINATGGGGGSQTPWTSAIDAAGYPLNNLNTINLDSSNQLQIVPQTFSYSSTNVLIDPGFLNGTTSWTYHGTTWTFVNRYAIKGAGVDPLGQNYSLWSKGGQGIGSGVNGLVIGNYYKLTYQVVAQTVADPNLVVSVGGYTAPGVATVNNTTYTVYFECNSQAPLLFTPSSTSSRFLITNVSLVPAIGNAREVVVGDIIAAGKIGATAFYGNGATLDGVIQNLSNVLSVGNDAGHNSITNLDSLSVNYNTHTGSFDTSTGLITGSTGDGYPTKTTLEASYVATSNMAFSPVGWYGYNFYFDGVGSQYQYMKNTDDTLRQLSAGFSICMQVEPSGHYGGVLTNNMSFTGTDGQCGFSLVVSSNEIRLYKRYDNTSIAWSTSIPVNTNTNIILVVGNSTTECFINGTSVGTRSNLSFVNNRTGTGLGSMCIGYTPDNGNFTGSVAGVCIYTRALSNADVAVYAANGRPANPYSKWEGNGTGADTSGNNNNLSAYFNATYIADNNLAQSSGNSFWGLDTTFYGNLIFASSMPHTGAPKAIGNITAVSFKTIGGTNTQFILGDGTLGDISLAQTPWLADINGNNKNLYNVASLYVNQSGAGSGLDYYAVGDVTGFNSSGYSDQGYGWTGGGDSPYSDSFGLSHAPVQNGSISGTDGYGGGIYDDGGGNIYSSGGSYTATGGDSMSPGTSNFTTNYSNVVPSSISGTADSGGSIYDDGGGNIIDTSTYNTIATIDYGSGNVSDASGGTVNITGFNYSYYYTAYYGTTLICTIDYSTGSCSGVGSGLIVANINYNYQTPNPGYSNTNKDYLVYAYRDIYSGRMTSATPAAINISCPPAGATNWGLYATWTAVPLATGYYVLNITDGTYTDLGTSTGFTDNGTWGGGSPSLLPSPQLATGTFLERFQVTGGAVVNGNIVVTDGVNTRAIIADSGEGYLANQNIMWDMAGNFKQTSSILNPLDRSTITSPSEGQMAVDNTAGNHLYIYLNGVWNFVL